MNGSAQAFDLDVAIIGAGSGGFAAARTAVGHGLKVAVIEGGEEVGGLCILRGCMPTKALLYAAEVMHLARVAGTWGVRTQDVSYNFAQVMARKNAMLKDFADYRVNQLHGGKFQFIRALATFRDAHTLELSNGQSLTARHFVISTGSMVGPYRLPQLAELDCLTSDSALKLERRVRLRWFDATSSAVASPDRLWVAIADSQAIAAGAVPAVGWHSADRSGANGTRSTTLPVVST